MNKLFFLLTYLILFYSCISNTQKEIQKLYSHTIQIPNGMRVLYNGKDTIINDIYTCDYKLVIYTDSLECSSCNINKMSHWEPILKYLKNFNDKIKLYFIYKPYYNDNIDVLLRSFSNNPINYPVLIDKNGDFEKLNPNLPKNKAMHTFLLDENNKVILVGNPIYNKEVERLFYKKSQKLLSK